MRFFLVLLVFVVAATSYGPGVVAVDKAREARQRSASPEPGPGQRWGSAADLDHIEAGNRRNTAAARSLQADYPPIDAGRSPDVQPAQVRTSTAEPEVRGFDSARSRELPDLRQRTSRTFANPDGTRTTDFTRDPINYQDVAGKWHPIDTKLVPIATDGSSGQGWRNTADSVAIRLAPTAEGQIARVGFDDEHSLAFKLDSALPVRGRVTGSTVTYPGVRPEVDLRLEVIPGGVKESLVLHSVGAGHTWLFSLDLVGLNPVVVDGQVELRDEQGTVIGRIPRGYMVDSSYNPQLGEPATSYGVEYDVVPHGAGHALRMRLDTGWLADPARKFPVVVDPPVVDNRVSPSSMYVQRNSDGSNFSRTDDDLKVGHSRDGAGSYTAASYVAFPGVETALRNHKIFGARLGLLNFHSWSCTPRPVSVHPVSAAWTAGSGHTYPGPAYGAALNSSSFAYGHIPSGSSASPCPTATAVMDLGARGRDLVQRWANGTQPNHGLTVRASESDVYGWKKFTGAGTANPPMLSITHSPYDADYAFIDPVPDPPVTRNQGGTITMKVTNRSAAAWSKDNYSLIYRVFSAKTGAALGWAEAGTLPHDVPRGGTAQVSAFIRAHEPGSYRFEFSMWHRGVAVFTDYQIPPAALVFDVPDVAPVLRSQYPPNGHSTPTLRPTFWAQGVDIDAPPNSTLKYRYEICPKDDPENCVDSGYQTAGWTIPAGKLKWSETYKWRAFAYDGTSESPALPQSTLFTAVPQPQITSHLGTSSIGGRRGEFDPQVGNFTTGAVDAAVAVVGPPLSVARTYNSLDPRHDAAFGGGWSTQYDMRATPDTDGSGNVVVTYPDGRQVRFGANLTAAGIPDGGTLVAPAGRTATLEPKASGGWTLTDQAGMRYQFASSGRLAEMADSAGRSVSLSYRSDSTLATVTSQTSGRTLRFSWTGGHVTAVSTDAVGGDPLTWTYTYDGDRLTGVCDPTGGCSAYEYATGTRYRGTIMDTRPDGYWRLGETEGDVAHSQVTLNVGTDKAHYRGITWGAPGVVAGSVDTAVEFAQPNSAVVLPDGQLRKSRELAVEMWFKTTAGGPLIGAQNSAFGTTSSAGQPLLYVGADGKLRGQFRNGQVAPMESSGPVNDGQWHHVVLSSSLLGQTLYLDGTAVDTLNGSIDNGPFTYAQVGAAFTQSAATWPGWGTAAQRSFAGVIDEVAVYQHPLGLPTVRAHHKAARETASLLTKVVLPSGKTAAALTYDVESDRVVDYVDRDGGTWTISQAVLSGSEDNLIRSIRVLDPGRRANDYEYDPARGRLVRYSAPLGTGPRSEDLPPPTTSPASPPPPCPPPPGAPPFCEVPIGGPGSFEPVDLQGVRTFGYDDEGFQSEIRDENANSIRFTRDERGNVLSRTTCRALPDNCQTAYFEYYTASGDVPDPRSDKVIAARDPRSTSPTDNAYRTTYTYTDAGDLQSQTTPDGAVVQHEYTTATTAAFGGGTTPAGLVLASTDPRGAVTRYAYFANGDLAEVTDPAGMRTRYTYDEIGRRTSTTYLSEAYPAGVKTTVTYDQLSRPVQVTGPPTKNAVTDQPHTLRTTTTYDADGNPTQVDAVDLSGASATRTTTVEYDQHNRPMRIVNPEGGETQHGYDAFGNRVWTVNEAGVRYEYAYTPRNKIAEVRLRGWTSDPPGSQSAGDYVVLSSFAYDLAGQLVRSVDGMGRHTQYSYFADGLLARETAKGFRNADGSYTRDLVTAAYTYDAAGNLASVTGPRGLRSDYKVDAVGRRTSTVLDPSGLARRTIVNYDLGGLVTKVAMSGRDSNTGYSDDLASEVVEYAYDTAGRRTSETTHTGAEALTTRFGYDQRGLVTSVTDPRGTAAGADAAAFTTNYAHDELGRPTTVTAPTVTVQEVGQTPRTHRPKNIAGYDVFGSVAAMTDANGETTTTRYDRMGRPVEITSPPYTAPGADEPTTATSFLEYDLRGRVVASTDPRGAVTKYAYDQVDRVSAMTQPDAANPNQPGGVWKYEYTRTGELLATVNPLGARSESTYDDLGRTITTTQIERNPAGTHTTNFSYDDAGNPVTSTSPSGEVTNYTYDILNQLTQLTAPAGVRTHFGYDRSGRLVKQTDGKGRVHRTVFDLAGRATKEIDIAPSGSFIRQSRFGFDRAGNLATAVDPLGKSTTLTWDALNRTTRQVEPVSGTESITTSFGYDAAGNQTRYTNGRGHTTEYGINAWGLVESVIEPPTDAHPNLNDRTWSVAYDSAKNPTTMVAPGGVRRDRTFDGHGRLTREVGTGTSPPTAERVFGYDLVGRLTSSSAPSGTNEFAYNDRGLLTATSGPSGQSAFTYDANGRMTARTDASGTSRYTYTNGRLNTLQDGITDTLQTIGYDSAGFVSSVDYGDGRLRELSYDTLGRLTTDTLGTIADGLGQRSATQAVSNAYSYDNANRLTAKTTTGVAAAGANTYTYDFAGRLASWTKDGAATTYNWDAAGNRVREGATTATYDERNRLLTRGAAAYTYTPRGTLQSRTEGANQETFSFDAFDRLIAQSSTTYTYDSLDRVAARNGVVFAYSGATNELAADSTGNTYARGPFAELLALSNGPDNRLTLIDRHDDLIGGFDPTAPLTALNDSAAFDPFGKRTATAGAARSIGFQSDYTDPDTGDVNMTARWYDPDSGSFTSRDDVELPATPSAMANRYSYGAASPINYTDPSGNTPSPDWCLCPPYPISGGVGGEIGSGLGFDGPPNGPPPSGPTRPSTSPPSGPPQGPPPPPADPAVKARAESRERARTNPAPTPPAMNQPHYDGSRRAPVSTAPDAPSHVVGDYRSPVQDVERSYQALQKESTQPTTSVLGLAKLPSTAPTEVAFANNPIVTTTGAGPPAPSGPTATPPSTQLTLPTNHREWEEVMSRGSGGDGCIAEVAVFCFLYWLYAEDAVDCGTEGDSIACASVIAGAVGGPLGKLAGKLFGGAADLLRLGDEVAGAADAVFDQIGDYRKLHNVGGRKNVALAKFEINGTSGERIGVSGSHQYKGSVPASPANPRLGRGDPGVARDSDSEWKILEDLASTLDSSASGRIHIYTERPACASCRIVIDNFKRMYPNIEVTYSDYGR